MRGAGAAPSPARYLDGVPAGLPALTRAVKLQKRAGKVGFDWNDPHAVIAKLGEEIIEIEAEIATDVRDPDRIAGEIGDILFAAANLARHLSVDPEAALRRANQKFIRRFGHIEAELARRGRPLGDASLDEMDALWVEAKEREAPTDPASKQLSK